MAKLTWKLLIEWVKEDAQESIVFFCTDVQNDMMSYLSHHDDVCGSVYHIHKQSMLVMLNGLQIENDQQLEVCNKFWEILNTDCVVGRNNID